MLRVGVVGTINEANTGSAGIGPDNQNSSAACFVIESGDALQQIIDRINQEDICGAKTNNIFILAP